VLSRKFGPKRGEGAEGWRRLHTEELRNLYASPDNIRVIKLKRMRWAGHVVHTGEIKIHTKFLLENLKGIDQLEDIGLDQKVISEWIFGK
jgi:hypothetical protein